MNRYLHKNGAIVQMSWSAAWSESQASVFAVGRDVTAKLASDERLRRAQKMEAVGRLTGGVAHDFNNLLTIVVGGAEALTDMLEPGSEAHDIAQLTLQAGERGADLVNSLLTFSRGQSLDPAPINARSLFEWRALPESIELRADAHAGVTCLADKSQLESVLLNLCINARDAMPAGGLVRIEARAVDLTTQSVESSGLTPGRYVRLTVSDNGQGMDAKTLDRATEPFFTTKAVGKGTGLGLAMAYGFARQSNGVLRIRSKPGKGTTVDLFLPWSDSATEPVEAAVSAPARRSGAKILVVEDDDLVRAHLVRLLRDLGYNVVQSEDGAKALDVLHRQHDIDLVLTDIVMPGGINGRELAERARVLRPDLRVLFTTGYTDDEIINAGILYSEADLLRKPYRRAQLAERVDGALSRVEHSLVFA
jgi:CheY-like chemotaxis protein